jgi:hypothetical protein
MSSLSISAAFLDDSPTFGDVAGQGQVGSPVDGLGGQGHRKTSGTPMPGQGKGFTHEILLREKTGSQLTMGFRYMNSGK